MSITNAALMTDARSRLKGKWGSLIPVSLIYLLIAIVPGSIPKIGWIINIIIGGPLMFGLIHYFLSFTREKKPVLEDLFKGFSIFARTFVAYLLMIIYVILWALLLIVPGIIAGISYSMAFYLMADNPEISGQDAIRKSKELMQGNKYRYFCLICRFTGWFLLGIVTCGIGFLWIMPYFLVSSVGFYEDLIKAENKNQNSVIQ